jgi:hypothetical protein
MKLIDILLEDITAGQSIVYHRTKNLDSIKNLKYSTFNTDGGGYDRYGKGVYCFQDLDSALNSEGGKSLGKYIIKAQINNIKDFLILDKEAAKRVFSSRFSIMDQIKAKKIDISDYKDLIDQINKADSGEVPANTNKQGDLSSQLSSLYKSIVMDDFKGITFTSPYWGKMLVVFNPSDIRPLSYSEDNGDTWLPMSTSFHKNQQK